MINRARQALHQAPLETGPEPDDEDDADAQGQATDAA